MDEVLILLQFEKHFPNRPKIRWTLKRNTESQLKTRFTEYYTHH